MEKCKRDGSGALIINNHRLPSSSCSRGKPLPSEAARATASTSTANAETRPAPPPTVVRCLGDVHHASSGQSRASPPQDQKPRIEGSVAFRRLLPEHTRFCQGHVRDLLLRPLCLTSTAPRWRWPRCGPRLFSLHFNLTPGRRTAAEIYRRCLARGGVDNSFE